MPYNGVMRLLGKILSAARNPVEGIIFIFSTGLFVYAIYLLSPWYAPNYPTAISAGLGGLEAFAAIFFAVTALPGMVAPFMRKERRTRSLKIASIAVFLSFLFLMILRIVIFGWIPLTWLPLIMISLASGYLHVWLKVRQE
jgi:hypothetical protein